MLNSNDLKTWLPKLGNRLDKLLIVLATQSEPVTLSELRKISYEAGFRIPSKWNVSDTLRRSKGLALNTPLGWEISETGKGHLRDKGISNLGAAVINVVDDLKKLSDQIVDVETRNFVLEAVNCHEAGFYRASIILSWIGAVSVLHKYVAENQLDKFNDEASRVDKKWKRAANSDDLGKMNEDKFLDTLERISTLGKSTKESLKECLKKRNGCGHPNSLKVSANQSAAHIEVLILNVFEPFSS